MGEARGGETRATRVPDFGINCPHGTKTPDWTGKIFVYMKRVHLGSPRLLSHMSETHLKGHLQGEREA